MSKKLTATLKLNRNDAQITLNEKLSECTNAVFFGINSLNIDIELPQSLSVDENSIFTHEPVIKMDLEASRINFNSWVLKKGFEDLIAALTELMISFCNIIDLNSKIKDSRSGTLDDFAKVIFGQNEINTKLHFPILIKKVKGSLKSPLKYNIEILTLNKVRNCLVHRNGVIHETDFNFENGLILKWWYYDVKLKQGKRLKELKRFDIIKPSENNIQITPVLKTKFFKRGERIAFDFQEFNELSHFCQSVGFDMLNKFELTI